jgi:hypothetical protein
MSRFLADAILKPFVAILFCLVFGGAFVFAGYQTLDLRASKDPAGAVTFDYVQGYLLGLVRSSHRVADVRGVEMRSHRTRSKGRTRTMTRVVLVHAGGIASLSGMSSNVNDGEKRALRDAVDAFLRDPSRSAYEASFTFRNVFLWVGLPLLLIGVAGLVGWPFSILKALGSAKPAGPPPVVR